MQAWGLDLGSRWAILGSGDTAVETIIVKSIQLVDQSGFGLCPVGILHGLRKRVQDFVAAPAEFAFRAATGIAKRGAAVAGYAADAPTAVRRDASPNKIIRSSQDSLMLLTNLLAWGFR